MIEPSSLMARSMSRSAARTANSELPSDHASSELYGPPLLPRAEVVQGRWTEAKSLS